jgi:ligand-binding sensor domain-containing protein
MIPVAPDRDIAVGGRVFVDREARVWVGLQEGIGRVSPDRSRVDRVDVLPRGAGSLAIAQDRAGAIWILSNDGVFELPPNAVRATTHRLSTLANAPNPAPIAIHADRGGTIWVGTVWGLYRHELRKNAFAHIEHDPRNPNSLSEGLVEPVDGGRSPLSLCSDTPLPEQQHRLGAGRRQHRVALGRNVVRTQSL